MEILREHKNLRLEGYDYSHDGCYFITVVTENRRELFGHIKDNKLCLNTAGCMVKECIDALPARFQRLEIPYSVVMPNHIHAIMVNQSSTNISEIMRQFKAVTARMYNKEMQDKRLPVLGQRLWQRSFYDIIIRNQRMFDYISNYILVNPERWIYDKMNGSHIDNADEIYKEIIKMR